MSTLCCRSCASASFSGGLDFGPQPIANRFKAGVDTPEPRYPLHLVQCEECGLVQLEKSFPAPELCPRFDWIKYREREDHLDDALLTFLPLLRQDPDIRMAAGISDYDTPLLQRISAALGISAGRISARDDLDIIQAHYGSETLQLRLTPERGRRIVAQHGPHQLLVSRYLLEHAERPREMLACFREILDEAGWLLLEAPDATQPLEQLDYPVIWEEHVTYFTEATIRSLLHRSGFSVAAVYRAPSKFEKSMLVLARRDNDPPPASPVAQSEINRFRHFVSSFALLQNRFEKFCSSKKSGGFTLALLGAGHFACAFANYFRLTPYLSFVADDDPNKAHHFLPGTPLEILPTTKLDREGQVLALLCLNPDGEDRAMSRIGPALGRNTVCLSIFSASSRFCLEAADA
jgi:hypothetical protein